MNNALDRHYTCDNNETIIKISYEYNGVISKNTLPIGT